MAALKGNNHDYLVMTLDHSQSGKVKAKMKYSINGILSAVTDAFKIETPKNPTNHLFDNQGAY